MDVSSDSNYVGIATSEGEAFLLEATTLRVKKTMRKAHMVFATSLAFAGDSHAFVSTSADASARVVTIPLASSSYSYVLLFILFILLLFGAIIVFV